MSEEKSRSEDLEAKIEQKIKNTQLELIAWRKQLLQLRQEDAFLNLCHITSKVLASELKQSQLLKTFLCDSAQDGEEMVYYIELQLQEYKHHNKVHTNPHMERNWDLVSDAFWLHFFESFLVNKKGEKPKDNHKACDLLHLISEEKDIDDKAWQKIQNLLPRNLFQKEKRETYQHLLKGILYARFLYVMTLLIENEQSLPGLCFPCTCVSHYVASENQWYFPCIQKVL